MTKLLLAALLFLVAMPVMALPATIDLSAGMPPVGNQGRQSSCVAWAVGYYVKTYQEGQERGWDVNDPAHQFSPTYIYQQRNTDRCWQDTGMGIPDAMRIVIRSGCLPLSEYRYNDQDTCSQPTAEQRARARQYRASDYACVFMGRGNAEAEVIKIHLAEGRPVVVAIPTHGVHAVTLVGYDATGFAWVDAVIGYGRLDYADLPRAYEAWVMWDFVPTKEYREANDEAIRCDKKL